MNANKAIELGFADDVLKDEKLVTDAPAFAFSGKAAENALMSKLVAKAAITHKSPFEPEPEHGRSVDDLMERLNLLKN